MNSANLLMLQVSYLLASFQNCVENLRNFSVNGWEWEIHPQNEELEWKIILHWVSSPTQISKFWDTARSGQR